MTIVAYFGDMQGLIVLAIENKIKSMGRQCLHLVTHGKI
jgi:hypothetical protein